MDRGDGYKGTPEFSIVCPIKDEVNLIPFTLPSFYSVNPSEVILCLDKPAPQNVVETIRKVAKACDAENITRIIEVERNPEYKFHQAWVRRKGFLEAKNDKILTTDIDLIINRNVLKAVNLVGKNNIGLVSCYKFRMPRSFVGLWRTGGRHFLRMLYVILMKRYPKNKRGLRMSLFTGLYALYRPFWLETEDEGIKILINPKQPIREGKTPIHPKFRGICLGEDTYLRNCMEKKYRVVYLPCIGARVLSDPLHDHPAVQYWVGRYNARIARSYLGAVIHVVMHLHFNYFRGFVAERKIMKKALHYEFA